MSNVLTGRHLAMSMARRFAEANMVSSVRITRTADPVLDEVTGLLDTPPPVLVYEGKARVSVVSGPMTMNLGDESQYFSGSNISIPALAGADNGMIPMIDDTVDVLVHDDPIVLNMIFRILDVEGGGHLQAARRLQVTGAQRSRTWSDGRDG